MANNRTNAPERQPIPELTLSADQLKELKEMSRFSLTELDMIASLSPLAFYADFKRLIYRCGELGLNPLNNDIHLEYRYMHGQPKAQFVIHIDGYRKIADASGEMDGFSQKIGEDFQGKFVDTIIWRKNRTHPFECRVYFTEFIQFNDTSLYGSKPYHMVSKCSAALCYKIAFPMSGMTTEDELAAWIDPAEHVTAAAPEPEKKSAYHVGEIADPQADIQADTVAHEAEDKSQETQEVKAEIKPATEADKSPVKSESDIYKELATELKEMGLKKPQITQYLELYFDGKEVKKVAPADINASVKLASDFIRQHGLKAFLDQLVSGLEERDKRLEEKQHEEQAQPAKTPDPKFMLLAVAEKFPGWPPSLVKCGSLWCQTRNQSPDTLEAFLIANSLEKAPIGRVEAFLAIMRFLSNEHAPALLKLAHTSGKPLSQIESEVSGLVGGSLDQCQPSDAVAGKIIGYIYGAKQ